MCRDYLFSKSSAWTVVDNWFVVAKATELNKVAEINKLSNRLFILNVLSIWLNYSWKGRAKLAENKKKNRKEKDDNFLLSFFSKALR